MKRLNKILIGVGTATGITAAWAGWEYWKAIHLQHNIDSIPYEIENEKDRRAKWFTKYRGRWF